MKQEAPTIVLFTVVIIICMIILKCSTINADSYTNYKTNFSRWCVNESNT